MRFHSQLFSQDWTASTFSMMERQVGPPLLHLSYLYWTAGGNPDKAGKRLDGGGELLVVMNILDL